MIVFLQVVVALAQEPRAPLSIRRCGDASVALPAGVTHALSATAEIRTPSAQGTGVVVSADGFILTAAHVVQGLRTVKVRVEGAEPVDGHVLRTDTVHDVALLWIGGTDHACLPLAASPPTIGGDLWVVGAPRGDQAFSIMRGIVSATRTVDDQVLLQTDAAINPGDSGGPMLVGDGSVTAITSWKVAGTAFEGIGFGVPWTVAQDALNLAFGDVSEADPLSQADPEPHVATETPGSDVVAQLRDRMSRQRDAQRRAGFAAIGVGSAGVVAGGAMYFGSLGRYLAARDLSASDSDAIDLEEWRGLQAVNGIGIGLAGVGAAADLIGALMVRKASHVAVVPSATGFQVVGRF